MGRRRRQSREGWPKNLYVNMDGYHWHKNPVTGKATGLGKDEANSIIIANAMNGEVEKLKSEFIPPVPLLSKDEILEGSRKWSLLIGVYFLIKGGEVVYVGQSVHAARRIAEHRMDGVDFDAYHVIECKESELGLLEKMYIAKFTPPLNTNSIVWRGTLASVIY